MEQRTRFFCQIDVQELHLCFWRLLFPYYDYVNNKTYNTISYERGLASMERVANVEFYFLPIVLVCLEAKY
jgi:hypothetical protein